MDTYLSNIDSYIQEQENQQHQQLYFLQQQQQQSSQQQQQQQQQQPTFDPTQWSTFNTNDFTQSVMNIPNGNTAAAAAANMYMSNMLGYPPNQQQQGYHQQQQIPLPPPGFDIHGNPIKIRKKPGRKPNPASPALRKMQNRAAQRAFRERKEKHLKDLENTIKTLREQRNNTAKELKKVKNKLEVFKTENWYLKGVMLTLQFMCMHHNIDLPPHTPYLAEEVLMEMAKTHPHAIEAYVNAYTRNNLNLKPNLNSSSLNNSNTNDNNTNNTNNANNNNNNNNNNNHVSSTTATTTSLSSNHQSSPSAQDFIGSPGSTATQQFGSMNINDQQHISSPSHHHNDNHSEIGRGEEDSLLMDHEMKQEYDDQHHHMDYKQLSSSPQQQHHENESSPPPMTPKTSASLTFEHEDVAKWTMDDAIIDDDEEDEEDGHKNNNNNSHSPYHGCASLRNSSTNPSTSLGAIQRIRLQLRVQSTLAAISGNYLISDRLQPTLLQLAIPHDLRIDLIPAPMMRDRMIIFRDQMDYDRCFSMLLNGAVYHGGDPTLSQSWELPPSFHSEYWFLSSRYDLETTNRWRRLKNLPEIDPSMLRQWTPPPPSPPSNSNSVDNHPDSSSMDSPGSGMASISKHPLYEKVLGIPPELRQNITSPTLDMMMEMMNSLSTNQNRDTTNET
ncbi:unnamed protein product [Cunninghamella blakesleeana]